MSIKAMEMALEALEVRCGTNADERKPGGVIEALRTAIQQAEAHAGEPVYQICKADSVSISTAWVDVQKQQYDDAAVYPEYGRRVLYPCTAIQKAITTEPVAWMHWLRGPVRVFMNTDEAVMELERLNREYPLDAGDRKMRPLVFGDTHPAPGVPDDVVRGAISTVREQYRGTDWGKAAECICDAIDAAMLADK